MVDKDGDPYIDARTCCRLPTTDGVRSAGDCYVPNIYLFVSMRTFPLGDGPGGSGQDEYSELGGKLFKERIIRQM